MTALGDRLQVVWLAAIVIAVGAAAGFACSSRFAGTRTIVFIYGGVTVALALIGAWRAWKDEELAEWLRPAGLDITRGCFAGGLLLAGAYLFSKLLLAPDSPRAGWLARFYLQLGDPSVLRERMTFVSIAICVVAIAEELLWRGLVVALLTELVGSRRAWLYAAVLYTLAHVPTAFALADPKAGLNPLVVIAAFGCGLVWSGLVRWTGRLVPSIVSHALFAWFVVMMFRLWGTSV